MTEASKQLMSSRSDRCGAEGLKPAAADALPLVSRPRAAHDVIHRAIAYLAMVLLAGSVLGASFVVTPRDVETGRVALLPTCWSLRLFDRPCPSCGMTRAFAALSHGELDRALEHNPVSVPAYALCWLLGLYGGLGFGRAIFLQRRQTAARRAPQ